MERQVCQRLMMQGLPRTILWNGALDGVCKVINCEGFRGLRRGFGLTAVTQSPASALQWGAYGVAQHNIWRLQQALLLGLVSSIFTTPVDTVMDNFGVGRPSVVKSTKARIREDGWQGFYRGFEQRFSYMSLFRAIAIVTYELKECP